jgi:CheY-like chemotaxis protein/anti-sigma regulatory factor (Ser/Thr protein kinase)
VQSVLEEAVRMIEPLARDAAVRIEAVHDTERHIGVMADPLRLRQVLINLLSNAIKYNPRSGGVVRLELDSDDDEVRIDVVDTGLGMSRDQLDHLFEPFNRLGQEHGGIEGSGIGLALTRQLVLLMQGHMAVESELGRGTRVKLALPSCHLPMQHEAACMAIGAPEPELPQPSGVVLYVEDNPVNQLLVEHMLARWSGVRVVKAETGASGIEVARRERPDLVLLDMQLPDMHGTDVLQTLQADEATRGLRVIALSASAMPQEVEHALHCGASDYWTKPLDFNGFLKEMQRVLPSEAVSRPA